MCKAIQELMELGRSEGRNEGFKLAAQVVHMNAEGNDEATISKLCEIPVEKVREILQLFQ